MEAEWRGGEEVKKRREEKRKDDDERKEGEVMKVVDSATRSMPGERKSEKRFGSEEVENSVLYT